MSVINCIIIDDEELARKLLEVHVEKIPHLNWMGSFDNPLDAHAFLNENKVDLIFLDIQMPQLKGTEFAALMTNSGIRIIFTTAYSEYALEGYELNALDYLLKPITFKRFLSAVEKFPKTKQDSDTPMVIKSGYNLHKVMPKDIIYIKSDSEYVNYHLENGKKIMAHQSLSKLMTTLPNYFIRVHRSYIVNKLKVTGLKGRDILLNEHLISVSDSYFDKVKEELF